MRVCFVHGGGGPFPPSSGWAWQGEATGVHVYPGGTGPAEDACPSHTFPFGVPAPRGAGTNPITPTQHSRPEVRVKERDKNNNSISHESVVH